MTVQMQRDIAAVPTPPAEVWASATLLPTGEALLLIKGTGPRLPVAGRMQAADETLDWQATVWERPDQGGNGWFAFAVVDALPYGEGILFEPYGTQTWVVARGARVGASAPDLIARAQAIGADTTAIFHFLAALLHRCRQADKPQKRAFHAFVQDFLEVAAVRDGFIELIAEPLSGGLFLQGWAQTIGTGPLRWISADEPLATPDLTVAVFERPDLLSPARGLCVFHKDLSAQDLIERAVGYVEQEGRILRLDLVSTSGPRLVGSAASEHVAQMIPRLVGGAAVRSSFQRICRPLYESDDTLSASPLPIAVGFDVVLRAPDGTLLVTGWMLDPNAVVDLVMIKSRSDRYAPISKTWVRLPRPDLAQAFAADPRFAGRIDTQVQMSGFIVHVPPGPDSGPDEEIYLEIVLEDHNCLFRPMRATAVRGVECLPPILTRISPTEPELARIIDDHIVPFASSIRPETPMTRRSGTTSSVPLGRARDPAPVAALMPFATMDELQPVFGLLAGTPDAVGLDLTLIAPRGTVEEGHAQLQQAFRFYGLAGRVVIAPDQSVRAVSLDIAMQSTDAEQVLVWSPRALPKAPGWLRALRAEAAELDRPGLISPLLTYEDGSLRFGPQTPGQASCIGFGRWRLIQGSAVAVPAVAADIALIDRARLAAAGGFAGCLFSDAFGHVDLSMRMAAAGSGIWCSATVEFWSLDDPAAEVMAPVARILRQVDARLLALRGALDPEEHLL